VPGKPGRRKRGPPLKNQKKKKKKGKFKSLNMLLQKIEKLFYNVFLSRMMNTHSRMEHVSGYSTPKKQSPVAGMKKEERKPPCIHAQRAAALNEHREKQNAAGGQAQSAELPVLQIAGRLF